MIGDCYDETGFSLLHIYSEGKQWKALRSKLNPVFVPRKLGRHVHKLNAVNDTFIRVAQEGAEADGYSKDLMELLPYWSMEGRDGDVCVCYRC